MIPQHDVLPQVVIGNLCQADKVFFLDQAKAVHNIKGTDGKLVKLLDQINKFAVRIIVGSYCLCKNFIAQLLEFLNIIVGFLNLAFFEDDTENIKTILGTFSCRHNESPDFSE